MATKGSSAFFSLNQTDIAAVKVLRLRSHITVTCQLWSLFEMNYLSRILTDEDDGRKKSCGVTSPKYKGKYHKGSVNFGTVTVRYALELCCRGETLDGAYCIDCERYRVAAFLDCCRYHKNASVRVKRVTVGISILH